MSKSRLTRLSMFCLAIMMVLLVVGSCTAAPTSAPVSTTTVTTTVTTTATPAVATEKVYKWRMPDYTPSGTDIYILKTQFCDDVRVASGGRIDITPYGAAEIIPVTETWEALSTGSIDIAWSYGAYWLGKTKMAAFSTLLPFTVRNPSDANVVLYELGIEDLVRKAYVEHNVHLLEAAGVAHGLVFFSKFPIEKVSDFEGRKLRAAGFLAEALVEAGAAPVYFPVPEIYGALEKGVIDGSMNTVTDAWNTGVHEVTKYILKPPASGTLPVTMLMNLDTWESLPDDLKMILRACAMKSVLRRAANYSYLFATRESQMIDYGLTVTNLPPEEQKIMAGYSKKVIDKYAAEDPKFKEAWEILEGYLKMVGVL